MKRTSLSYLWVKVLPIFFIRSFLRLVLPNDGKGGNRWRRNNSRWGKMSGEIFFFFRAHFNPGRSVYRESARESSEVVTVSLQKLLVWMTVETFTTREKCRKKFFGEIWPKKSWKKMENVFEIRSDLTPQKIHEFMSALSSCQEMRNSNERNFIGTVSISHFLFTFYLNRYI